MVDVKVVQLPDSASFSVFIFGKNVVSICGVHSQNVEYYGEKALDHPVSYVSVVGQTSVQESQETIEFILGGEENASFDFMKVTVNQN